MEPVLYEHKVQYYETDKMDCVHHSNYIRWFEEARTYLMDQGGLWLRPNGGPGGDEPRLKGPGRVPHHGPLWGNRGD